MERNLIAPRVDVVFRVLFGRERNKDILVVKWVKFLKEGETMSLEQIQAWEEPAIKKAYEELEKLSQDPEKLGLEKGEKLGLEKGRINLLQSLAKKRFPHISEATIQLIEELNGKSLEELAESILDVADGRAFRHLLLQLKQKSTPEHPKDPSES